MPGRRIAVQNGEELKSQVLDIGSGLGLVCKAEVRVGRRLWGAQRRIDIVLSHPTSGVKLGVECKYQGVGGSTEEKIPVTLQDIEAWPIRGIVVIAGEGFSSNMRGFLLSTGKVVDLEDLEDWLKLFFDV
jgi:hypothetical protein